MNNHTILALMSKLIFTVILAAVAFKFVDANPWGWVFAVGAVTTILNYVVGDLLVLPAMGNLFAAVGDGLKAALVAYMFSVLFPPFLPTMTGLIVYGILVAVAEYFFHQYLISDGRVAP